MNSGYLKLIQGGRGTLPLKDLPALGFGQGCFEYEQKILLTELQLVKPLVSIPYRDPLLMSYTLV